MTCTFIGHRDAPEKIQPVLRATLIYLIENKHVNTFYVGNQGNFDRMVRSALKTLQTKYPFIHYAVVLAQMPIKTALYDDLDYFDTIYPDELRNTPPKYAIVKRNRWMIARSDYVVTYVAYIGNATKWKGYAEKAGKTVLNLTD